MMATFTGNQRVQKMQHNMNIQFEDYKNYLENDKLMLIVQQSFKNEAQDLYLETVCGIIYGNRKVLS